jgi:hypothetical protein
MNGQYGKEVGEVEQERQIGGRSKKCEWWGSGFSERAMRLEPETEQMHARGGERIIAGKKGQERARAGEQYAGDQWQESKGGRARARESNGRRARAGEQGQERARAGEQERESKHRRARARANKGGRARVGEQEQERANTGEQG